MKKWKCGSKINNYLYSIFIAYGPHFATKGGLCPSLLFMNV